MLRIKTKKISQNLKVHRKGARVKVIWAETVEKGRSRTAFHRDPTVKEEGKRKGGCEVGGEKEGGTKKREGDRRRGEAWLGRGRRGTEEEKKVS